MFANYKGLKLHELRHCNYPYMELIKFTEILYVAIATVIKKILL